MSDTSNSTSSFRFLHLPSELQDMIYDLPGPEDRWKFLLLNKQVHTQSSDVLKKTTYIELGQVKDKTSQRAAKSRDNAQEINVRLMDVEKSVERLRQDDSELVQHTANNSKLQRIHIEFQHQGELNVTLAPLPLSTMNIPSTAKDKPTVQVVTGMKWNGPYYCYLVSVPGDQSQQRPTEHCIGQSRRSCPFEKLAALAGTLVYEVTQSDPESRVVWVDMRNTNHSSSNTLYHFNMQSGTPEHQAISWAYISLFERYNADNGGSSAEKRTICSANTLRRLRCVSQADFEETEASQLLYDYVDREPASV